MRKEMADTPDVNSNIHLHCYVDIFIVFSVYSIRNIKFSSKIKGRTTVTSNYGLLKTERYSKDITQFTCWLVYNFASNLMNYFTRIKLIE